MPTIITHAAVGISAAAAVSGKKVQKKFWALSILAVVLPDVDVIGLKMGISYGSFWGHRGFLHSLSFALIVSLLIVAVFFRGREGVFRRWWQYWIYFSLLILTHGILDAFTNGGLGIALLSPFDNERYFFWTTPISVSPINPSRFFSAGGLHVMLNEIVWIWIPSIFLLAAGRFINSVSGYRNDLQG